MTATALARIGLLGGSFDPPHRAHLALAELALTALALTRVHWLVAAAPWQKAGRVVASAEQRLAMVTLLIEGHAAMQADARELQRAGQTFTIDSVLELRTEQPDAELFLIIGQDQYARLDTWVRHEELLSNVTLAVAARAGQAPRAPAALPPHRVHTLPLPEWPISSTLVREHAARGADLAPWVGQAVAHYISQQRLYQVTSRS